MRCKHYIGKNLAYFQILVLFPKTSVTQLTHQFDTMQEQLDFNVKFLDALGEPLKTYIVYKDVKRDL